MRPTVSLLEAMERGGGALFTWKEGRGALSLLRSAERQRRAAHRGNEFSFLVAWKCFTSSLLIRFAFEGLVFCSHSPNRSGLLVLSSH